jgi:hypothetical protein
MNDDTRNHERENLLVLRFGKLHKLRKRKGSVEMDEEDWNSEETKGSKGRKGTSFRKTAIEEEALQCLCFIKHSLMYIYGGDGGVSPRFRNFCINGGKQSARRFDFSQRNQWVGDRAGHSI